MIDRDRRWAGIEYARECCQRSDRQATDHSIRKMVNDVADALEANDIEEALVHATPCLRMDEFVHLETLLTG